MEELAKIDEMLDLWLTAALPFSTASEAASTAGLLERIARKVDAASIEVVHVVDRQGLYRADGHSSAQAWCAYTNRTNRRESGRRMRLAKMFRSLPASAERYRAGELGGEQANELSRAFVNPRCGHLLVHSEDLLLESASELSAQQFEQCVHHWLRLADAEGIRQRHETAHRCRDARFFDQFDSGVLGTINLGAMQGATVREIFDNFVSAERLADWDEARGRLGDKALKSDLQRTDAQQRADAFVKIFVLAASQPADTVAPEPVVHIVMSQDAYEAALATMAGEPVVLDPRRYESFRCETLAGTELDLADAWSAAMVGHIRRVVVGAPHASISQKTRVFTGPLRSLLNVLDRTCVWPGCELASHRCQADHTMPWRHSKDTSVGNGKPLCGRHNRLKESGYQTRRDPNGTWHVIRPDGTKIEPSDHPSAI